MKKIILFGISGSLIIFCFSIFLVSSAQAANGDVYTIAQDNGFRGWPGHLIPFEWPSPAWPTFPGMSGTAVAVAGDVLGNARVLTSTGEIYGYGVKNPTCPPSDPSCYCKITRDSLKDMPGETGMPIDITSVSITNWYVLTSTGQIWRAIEVGGPPPSAGGPWDCNMGTWEKLSRDSWPGTCSADSPSYPVAISVYFDGALFVLASNGHIYNSGISYYDDYYDTSVWNIDGGVGDFPGGRVVDFTMMSNHDPAEDGGVDSPEPYVLDDNGDIWRIDLDTSINYDPPHGRFGKYVWDKVNKSPMPDGHGSPVAIVRDDTLSSSCGSHETDCKMILRVLDSYGYIYLAPYYKVGSGPKLEGYYRINPDARFPGDNPVDMSPPVTPYDSTGATTWGGVPDY